MTEEDKLLCEIIEQDGLADINEEVLYPPVAVSVGEVCYGNKCFPIPLVTYGNFAFIYAQPKTKKTFLASLIGATYMADNEIEAAGGLLKGFREDKELLWIDTEQGLFHAHKTFKRLKPLTNEQYDHDKFKPYPLREYSYKDRINFIEYYLEQKSGEVGLVVIDGIADLVLDVNDLSEANELAQKLLSWTAKYKCAIITIIHANHGSDKPTGHLGSALEKKAETQIKLEPSSVGKEQVVKVICKRSRNTPFDNFYFRVNEHSLPEVIDLSYDFFQTEKDERPQANRQPSPEIEF